MLDAIQENLSSAGLWQAVGACIIPCLVVLIVVMAKRTTRRQSKQPPSPDQILKTSIEKIREEFADRIPIIRSYFVRQSPRLEVVYVVETAADEDSANATMHGQLWERTRDELILAGYFHERRDALSVRIISEERLQKFGIDFYIRWG